MLKPEVGSSSNFDKARWSHDIIPAIENLGLKPVEAARGKTTLGDAMTNSKTWVDWPPRQPITIMDLIGEARAVEWDFNTWCHASGYDASDPDARRMFECLLAYARREGRIGLN